MQSDYHFRKKQAISHTQTTFKLNKLYRYKEKGSKDGKQVFGGNSTIDANALLKPQNRKSLLVLDKILHTLPQTKASKRYGIKRSHRLSFIPFQRATCDHKHSKSSAQRDCLYLQSIFTKTLGDLGFTYAKKPRKLPSVLTPNEVQLIL
ncbi:hypothetical protein [Vibrio parahaemolyticus]|uniref:hypothetical protein n=1 Tax=Vibrio parahaemolyticus TaxID=670 RepID=UPI00402B4548